MKFKKDSNLINKFIEELTEEQKQKLHADWEAAETMINLTVQDQD